MTKQSARASLTFTTKFLCLHYPTWAWRKHSNGIQGQGGAHAHPGLMSRRPPTWYRWTCVTWRQLNDAPLHTKHSSTSATHHGEAFRDKLFQGLEFLSRGQDCRQACGHTAHEKHWDFHVMSSQLHGFFFVCISDLVSTCLMFTTVAMVTCGWESTEDSRVLPVV